MGYPELLRVLGEEAAREAREVRASAERERDEILERARAEAAAAREALVSRARAEADAQRRTRLESIGLERERTMLVERRRLLDELRAGIEARLAAAGSPEVDARLLAEVLPEAGDGPIDVEVDPGAEASAREAVARIAPSAAARVTVRSAPAPRGGVRLLDGRRVLDDTLGARLQRAWPDLEARLAAMLEEA